MSEKKPGPRPDRLKIDDDFEDALEKALKKKRPEDGNEERWEDEGGTPEQESSD